MILDRSAGVVVGHQGWSDNGALWLFELEGRTTRLVPIEGTKFVTLKRGMNHLFRVVHHHSDDQAISIRHTGRPDHELASVRVTKGVARFGGDNALWGEVESAAIITNSSGHQKAVLIDASKESLVDLDISWFNAENYDLGYQGLTDCINLNQLGRAVISVQRSSKLVVIDTQKNRCVDSILLANRGGNPDLQMHTSLEFFASDYDTLCRVDCRSLEMIRNAKLQDGTSKLTQQFIGDYQADDRGCLVARPFSGDVVLTDLDTFEIKASASTGGQPLSACQISEDEVLARDWKTGQVLMGHLKTTSRSWLSGLFRS